MKKMHLIFTFLFIFIYSVTYAQSVNIGLRFESFAYSIHNIREQSSDLEFMPIPLSGYLKAGILFYDKYEIELKAGVQLIDPFTGTEYAILFKYGILKKIFPIVTYLNHFNVGDSRTGNGTYSFRMDFIGVGVEAKLIKIFSLDLTYYIPINEKRLEYEVGNLDEHVTTSEMGPMIKIGFIFNIINF